MWRNFLTSAVRHLARNRLYAAISIASLTVGFAAAVVVGIFARHELSYDRFLPDHERIYVARQVLHSPGNGPLWRSNETRIDVAGYLKADFPQVEAVTRLQPHWYGVQRGDVIHRHVQVAWADPNLLQVLKLPLVSGDASTALTGTRSAVLTQALARRVFGDADPIGRTFVLRSLENGRVTGALGPPADYLVTAVLKDLPAETHLQADMFTPPPPEVLDDPPAPFGQEALTYVRLARGATPGEINRQLPAFVVRHIPTGPLMGSGFGLELVPLRELHLPSVHLDSIGDITPNGDRTILAAMIGVAGLILLTAAINFVGLTTAQASQRAVEVGVRKAVGAGRGQLFAQFMGESLIQVAIAFVVALSLGELFAPAFGRLVDRPLSLDYLRDARLLGILAAGALVVGLAAGAYPALVLAAFRPAAALRGGFAGGHGSRAVRQALVVAQFAVLVLLMIVIVTVQRQTRLALSDALRVAGQPVLQLNGRPVCGPFEDRVRALPGVVGAVCSANVVFLNKGAEGSAQTLDGRTIPIQQGPVEAGFFEFYGLRPLAGRTFDPGRPGDQPLMGDIDAASPPVVLNATAARRLGFASPQAAVGRTIRWDRLHVVFRNGQYNGSLVHNEPAQVLGVVPDYAGSSRLAPRATIYWPDPELMATLSIKLSGQAAPGVLQAVNRLWRQAGHFSVPDAEFLDAKVRKAYRDVTLLGDVTAACAALALALACSGLFALAAFTTEQRTKEIGVRKAMGAGVADIARLLLWQFSQPVVIASLIAWPAGWALMRWWLAGFADRVDLAPWSFAAVTAVAVLIAWATVLAQTLRAARTRPVEALRYE
jgi:putative ABC transport system permease protein